jgi:hypothetical protein
MMWQALFKNARDASLGYYGTQYFLIASTVAFSVIGVATWGTLRARSCRSS